MASYRYVIVGGGMAGGKACDGIRQVDDQGSIALVTQEPHYPYQRPPLSKKYLREEVGLEKVYLKDSDHYNENRVDMILESRVVKLSPDERRIALEDGRSISYEKLLLATGGRARRLSIPGGDLENVLTLRSIQDSVRIRENLGKIFGPVLVVGGSFIGAEVSASLRQLGAEVIEAFPGSRLLEKIVPPLIGEYLHILYAKQGVKLIPKTVCTRLEKDGSGLRATLDNGETLQVGIVVTGVGIRLNSELAQEAGLKMIQEDGSIEVDETLRTSDPHIYAAGDIATWPDPTFGQRLRVEHWDVARRQGLQAGRNMAGAQESYTALPYFFSDLFDLSFEVWGNLIAWDQIALRGSLQSGSFAAYYFDRGSLTGVLAVNRPDKERKPMQALVLNRPSYESIFADLQDERVDLDKLTGKRVGQS